MTKEPQDHLEKKPAAKAEAKAAPREVEVQGVVLSIDPDVLDDFELLGDLAILDSGTSQAALTMPGVLRSFLGPEQYRTVLEHLRDPDTGRVSITAGATFVGDLLRGLSPNS